MPLISYSEMKTKPIVFIDSGVGGLSYYKTANIKLPEEQFICIADRENFPYGNKNINEIEKIVYDLVGRVVKKLNPKIIVIACNTASVVGLAGLRERFDIPFIGVVPAVKPAANISNNKKIGIIATFRTTKDEYLEKLIIDFASDCNITRVAAGEIVDFVEKRYFEVSGKNKLKTVEDIIAPIKSKGIDSVVLACTHFLLLEEEFQKSLGKNVYVIDSRDGVINQLTRVLDNNDLRSSKQNKLDLFFITGDNPPEECYELFAEKFNLTFAGNI